MKILLMHHVETVWKDGYALNGTSFECVAEKIAEHLEENDYDRVILTQFEKRGLDDFMDFPQIAEKINVVHEYGYGWEASMFADGDNGFTRDLVCDDSAEILTSEEVLELLNNGESYTNRWGAKICLGGSHSEVVEIDSWIEDLKNHEVFLCGAFSGECIEDIQIAMNFCGVNYKNLHSLIV
jgi:hypothetical protein